MCESPKMCTVYQLQRAIMPAIVDYDIHFWLGGGSKLHRLHIHDTYIDFFYAFHHLLTNNQMIFLFWNESTYNAQLPTSWQVVHSTPVRFFEHAFSIFFLNCYKKLAENSGKSSKIPGWLALCPLKRLKIQVCPQFGRLFLVWKLLSPSKPFKIL